MLKLCHIFGFNCFIFFFLTKTRGTLFLYLKKYFYIISGDDDVVCVQKPTILLVFHVFCCLKSILVSPPRIKCCGNRTNLWFWCYCCSGRWWQFMVAVISRECVEETLIRYRWWAIAEMGTTQKCKSEKDDWCSKEWADQFTRYFRRPNYECCV